MRLRIIGARSDAMYKYILGMVSGMVLVAWGLSVKSEERPFDVTLFLSVTFLGVPAVNTLLAL